MKKYNCEICGEKHDVFKFLRSPLPDLILEIPEEKRELRIHESGGLYIIDKKWLIGSGHIYIQMEGLEEPIFCWQVWVTVSPDDFRDNINSLMKGEKIEVRGRLQSEIPFYERSKGLEANLSILDLEDGLQIDVKITEKSALQVDQSKLITEDRIIELMKKTHHSEFPEEQESSSKSFEERLTNELIYAEENYISQKRNFVINVNSRDFVLFQIVSNAILENKVNQELGFGLHISFDASFEAEVEYIKRFRQEEFSKDFEYFDLNEIPTYQIDLGKDKKAIQNLIPKLIKTVYGHELESIEMDNFVL